VEVVSSLINAINLKQYVRAYGYWQNAANTSQDYNSFAAGYADTSSVTATFGTATSNSGAGQLQYKVPLSMQVSTTAGTTKLYVGCYTLHLTQPGLQTMLPFSPLGIIDGKVKQVDNNTDTGPLLATACN
jgi:hypothetical protein